MSFAPKSFSYLCGLKLFFGKLEELVEKLKVHTPVDAPLVLLKKLGIVSEEHPAVTAVSSSFTAAGFCVSVSFGKDIYNLTLGSMRSKCCFKLVVPAKYLMILLHTLQVACLESTFLK